jgi:hypothetical protein
MTITHGQEKLLVQLDGLRRHANASAKGMAQGAFLPAFKALAKGMQAGAGRLYQEIAQQQQQQQQQHDEEDDFGYGDRDPVSVTPFPMDARSNTKHGPMFGHPFLVRPVGGEQQEGVAASLELILASTCAAVSFNMALSCHHEANALEKVDQEASEELLLQARVFYERCRELLDRATLSIEGTLVYLQLAVYNNLAEVALALGEQAEATEWQETVCCTVGAVQPNPGCPMYEHFTSAAMFYGVDDDVMTMCTL